MAKDNFGAEYGKFQGLKTLFSCPKDFQGEYVVKKGTERVGSSAFAGCEGLTSVVLPDSLLEIGSCAFSSCVNLKHIAIPQNLRYIGEDAFQHCNLESIVVDPKNEWFTNRSKKCNAIIAKGKCWDDNHHSGDLIIGCKNTIIPAGVKRIYSDAFFTRDIKEVHIPKSVRVIRLNAFAQCRNLETVTFEEGLREIEGQAFVRCDSLKSIYLPASVKEIGQYGFSRNPFNFCSGLTSIEVAPDNTVYDSRNNCNAIIETEKDKVVSACRHTVIPDGIKIIGEYAFSGCPISSISIPQSVTTIEGKAFAECDFETFVWPAQVTSICDWTFDGCKKLKTLIIPEGVNHIDQCAFHGCTELVTLELPSTLTEIPNYAIHPAGLACLEKLQNIIVPAGAKDRFAKIFSQTENKDAIPLLKEKQ